MKRRIYPLGIKIAVVCRLENKETTIEEVCSDLGVAASTVVKWVRQYRQNRPTEASDAQQQNKSKSSHPSIHGHPSSPQVTVRRTPDGSVNVNITITLRLPEDQLFRYSTNQSF